MGMYTELHYNVVLKDQTPLEVINALSYMIHGSGELEAPPDHPLFTTDRWGHMLRCDSYYFAADTHSTLRLDRISKQHVLCVRSNLKNYGDEIEKFVDWLDPWVDAEPGDFLGFSRHEESEEPNIIRKRL